MAHPNKPDHEKTGREKLHKITGEKFEYDSAYQRAEEIAGKSIDKIPMKDPEDKEGHCG